MQTKRQRRIDRYAYQEERCWFQCRPCTSNLWTMRRRAAKCGFSAKQLRGKSAYQIFQILYPLR